MRHILVLIVAGFLYATSALAKTQGDLAENQTARPVIDPQSGLVKAQGYNMVLAHCSACHSPSLIAQNSMSRERWLETIRWMQDTQKLWPLGEAEPVILDYLQLWYGPKVSSRRAPLAPHLVPEKQK